MLAIPAYAQSLAADIRAAHPGPFTRPAFPHTRLSFDPSAQAQLAPRGANPQGDSDHCMVLPFGLALRRLCD